MRLPWGRPRTLRLLTWNVWFGLERPLRRSEALFSTVSGAKADIIAFQEVTAPFLESLRGERWLKRSYTLSDPAGTSIDGYGNLIATRFTPDEISVEPFPSAMGRKLVVVEGTIDSSRWAFGCVHLESLQESAAARGRQLEQAFDRRFGR